MSGPHRRRAGTRKAKAPARARSLYEESILRSLRKILRGVALYNKRLTSLYRITGPQLICIRHLSRVGPSTHSQLAAAASLSKPTVTGIVDRLEARRIVTRGRTTTDDRRRVIVELTDAGRELAFTAPLPLQERFAENLARLSRAQQGEIDRMLERIVSMMEVADLDAAPILESSHVVVEPNRTAPARKRKAAARRGSTTRRPAGA